MFGMSENNKFQKHKNQITDTKQDRALMPAGGVPFGGYGTDKNVHNNVFSGINSDLIGRIVRDEKKDEHNKEKTDNNEEKNIDTTTTGNSANEPAINHSNARNKSNKNEEESSLKDVIELQKLMLLKEIGKENKQDRKKDSNDSKFENDYPDIYHNRGNRLFDTIGTQWFINDDAVKQQELVKKINWLLTPSSDYIGDYNQREKTLKQAYDEECKKHGDSITQEGKDLKNGIKSVNFELEYCLQNLVNSFMKRISLGKIDGKDQLTISKEDIYKMAQEIADLADKLQKEINSRKASNGMKLDQSSINERKQIVHMLNSLLYKCDLIGVNDVRHAIEADCERTSEIYNGLNIFQRFWYAFMDLIFGTNYNQEYNDIIAIQRLMIRELNLSDDEINSEKHYKHILKFCDLSNKLDNVRENMATFLLYPDKKTAEEIKKFKQDALRPTRSANSMFTGLFEICGGKMLSQYVPTDKRNKTRQYMQKLLADNIQIKGARPTASQTQDIIGLALSGKSGEEINDELNLIDEEDEKEKDGQIQKLDYSVSKGALGSATAQFTKPAIKEKGDLWQAKAFGYLNLIEQKYVDDQIANYDRLLHETSNFLNNAVAGSLGNLINQAMLEDESGLSKGSSQIAQLEPFIIGRIEATYNELLKSAEKFNIKDSEDKVYNEYFNAIQTELEKLSSEKLSKKDKEEGKKPKTTLGKLKQDKFEETYMFKELLAKMQSTNKMKKEYYDKVNELIKLNRKQLVDNIKEIFAKFKNRANLINAWQAHGQNDDKHLNVYKEVENLKSKCNGRHYNEMVEIMKNKGGRGGGPGMGMFGGW